MQSLSSFSTELNEKLSSSQHIALIAHKSPDGDALGSLEGLRGLLNTNYSHLTVTVVVPAEKLVDNHVIWILGTHSTTIPGEAELVLFLDASLLSRTALTREQYPTQPVITIDHHEDLPECIPGYRDIESPSTTVMLTDIARELHWTMTPDIATALLLGVYTDTGGFLHRNSSQRAFDTAAYLMSQGADRSRITMEAFGNYTIDYLHDLGDGLLSVIEKDGVACLFFRETDNSLSLKSHIAGYLSGLVGVDIACILMQRDEGVKGSFRTRKEAIDVNELAKKFGGGGHKKASGFTLEGAQIKEGKLNWENKTYTPEEFIDLIQQFHSEDKIQNTK